MIQCSHNLKGHVGAVSLFDHKVEAESQRTVNSEADTEGKEEICPEEKKLSFKPEL